ncbi:MAG: hypothetical protein GEV08_05320 [Acidimicrobiia bacterium]|nr:hypothetical protein [Acidimicrobiia bacterium]
MPRSKSAQPWSELSGGKKAGILALVAFQAVAAAFAQRDLSSRSPNQVRGPKLLWRVASLNTAGAVSYFVFGRRR